jgi:DNA-binding MarR family transcriptional regulator
VSGHRDAVNGTADGPGSGMAAAARAMAGEAMARDASANECIVGIVRAGEAFVALANRALSGYQLSPAARQALAVLDGAGEPLSPTEIARRLIVTTASVTSLLDTLERRGLVERRPDPADRRRLLVAITPPAQAMVRQYVPEVVALQGAVMSGIGEEDRQQLIAILTRIREAIAAASP